MSEDYENVEWNVHATSNTFTPRIDTPDPLSTYDTPYEPYRTGALESTTSSTLTSPLPTAKSNNYNNHATDVPIPRTVRTAKPMLIRIGDAQKHSDGTQGAYVSYMVTTTTSVEIFSSTNPRPVRRRFHDFVWLYNALCLEYPACIVPPLPEKHRLEYIKGDRFSSHFIERRILWQKNDKRAQSKIVPPSATVLESLSDTLLNAFVKIKKPEERGTALYKNRQKTTRQVIPAASTTATHCFVLDLEQDYVGFGQSIQGLAGMESGIHQPLHQFAETTKSYAKAMKIRSDQEEIVYLNQIHELLSYCQSAKAVLQERDQKQMDFEGLSAYLQQTIQDKDRINGNDAMNISELVVDKINEVRGMDMERARREKLVRLEIKIKELQEEVAQTNDISHDFSEQVVDEFELFQQCKTNEIKRGLTAYVDTNVDFYQKGITIWEKVLPMLEAIDVSDKPTSKDHPSPSHSISHSFSDDDETLSTL
ncbi:hypothetical protein [Absidia glauca]|uniref:Sorting nexin-4 n=1 Tax=Absidia glauca TaxID=4829 RepID=A0A168MCG0_ABSGL|nr:hypothetical protein [Absidia glauca]